MRLCAILQCIFLPSKIAFTIKRQGRNTGGAGQDSAGRRENPAAVADSLPQIPAGNWKKIHAAGHGSGSRGDQAVAVSYIQL